MADTEDKELEIDDIKKEEKHNYEDEASIQVDVKSAQEEELTSKSLTIIKQRSFSAEEIKSEVKQYKQRNILKKIPLF